MEILLVLKLGSFVHFYIFRGLVLGSWFVVLKSTHSGCCFNRSLPSVRDDILLCSFRFIRFSKKLPPSVLPANLRILVEMAKWRGGAKLISAGKGRR